MTSFGSGRGDITAIDRTSTISELIGLLVSSFRRKEFELVEEILMKREDDLKALLKKEQQDRCLFERKHSDAARNMLELQNDLEDLKNENLELQEELKILRTEKLVAARKFLEYERRMANLGKSIGNGFPADVSEIEKLASAPLENVLQKEGNSNLDCKQAPENALNHHNNSQASYGAPSPTNSPVSKANSSHQEKKGNSNLDCKQALENALNHHNNSQASYGAPSPTNSPVSKANSSHQEKKAASKSLNKICDTHRSPVVIEIIESDDEAPAGEKPYVSSKKGVSLMESGRNACPPEDKNERNIKKDPFESLLLKRKRGLTETDNGGISPVCKQRIETAREVNDGKGSTANNSSVNVETSCSVSQSGMPCSQSQMVNEQCQGLQRKLWFPSDDDSSYYSSSDSDDNCSEAHISNMIESLRQDYIKSAEAMQQEFLSNDELCMDAVCALYRKQIREKFTNSTSSSIDLDMFNEMRGKDIAEYLMDEDPQYKLKRTVSEVQEKDSRILGRCKILAIRNYRTLFEICIKKEDPFFHPSS